MDAFNIIFLVTVLALVAWTVVPQTQYLLRQMQSAKWPTATAAIQEDFVGSLPDGGHAASFKYQFAVKENLYRGQFLVIAGEDRATRLLKELDGQTIQVRYDPRRPEISFLINCYDSSLGGAQRSTLRTWIGR